MTRTEEIELYRSQLASAAARARAARVEQEAPTDEELRERDQFDAFRNYID